MCTMLEVGHMMSTPLHPQRILKGMVRSWVDMPEWDKNLPLFTLVHWKIVQEITGSCKINPDFRMTVSEVFYPLMP